MTTPPSPHTTRPGDQVAPRPAEFRALTGLRIVAAAWVVLFHFHFTGLDGVAAAVDVFGPLLTAGALGVDLFFVLSGFVIAHTYLDRLGPALQVAPTARFVWARACRIWPAYAVVFHLFGIWVVARLVWGSDDQVAFQAVQPVVSLPEYLQQLVLVQLWDSPFFDGASWVGSTWSISAEWLAYLLFPVAALVFHRLRDLPVALLAAGSLALMTPIAWAYLLTGSPYHPWSWAVRVLCGFGAGVLAHLVVRRLQSSASDQDGRASDRVRRWASATAAALPLMIAAGLLAGELVGPGRGGAVLVAFPVLIGALALADRGPAMWLARPWAVRGGHVSYSLYLVHIPMFEVFWLAQEHFPQLLGRSTPWGHAVGLAVLLLTLPVAALLHGLVEEPARLQLSRQRIHRPEHAPSPTRPIVFIPSPVGPMRRAWGSAAVAPHPRRAAGALHRRIAPGSRTVTVTEYVQRVL